LLPLLIGARIPYTRRGARALWRRAWRGSARALGRRVRSCTIIRALSAHSCARSRAG